ncbi:MAG: hypothetical protein JNK82_06350 [Myxococcaceae bacterium]|nr:hypothetical protein [Myxococcaceae bacterium]
MKTLRPEGPPGSSAAFPTPAAPPKAPVATETPAAKPPASQFNDPKAPRGADLEGARRGYTSPTQVESPFTPDEKAALSKKIPCPALAGMFNAGMLKVEKDGTVKIPDLERALSQLGPSSLVTKVLTKGADGTDDIAGSFNLFKLNGSNLDHTGSTGIRQDGVHPERFDLLCSFSKDGETLTAKDLADAADQFARESPGLRGRITQLAEMNAVLQVFGHKRSDGVLCFTFAEAKSLFVDGQIPASWSPPVVPGKIGLGDVLGSTALGLFRQLVNGK